MNQWRTWPLKKQPQMRLLEIRASQRGGASPVQKPTWVERGRNTAPTNAPHHINSSGKTTRSFTSPAFMLGMDLSTSLRRCTAPPKATEAFSSEFFGILSDFKEQTGIDLYECLQQCTAETRMSKQKVPDILGMSDKEVAQAERRWDSALSSRFPERKLERRDKRSSIPIYYGISPPRY